MKLEHKIYAALAILLLLAAGLYATRKSNAKSLSEHAATAASADYPSIALPKDDSDKVTKLEITTPKKDDKEKTTVVLEKKGEEWWVTSPVTAKANGANVKSVLDNLKDLKVKE